VGALLNDTWAGSVENMLTCGCMCNKENQQKL
jgi:hypothetical protein